MPRCAADKVLLVGRTAHASFGGGELLQPIEIYLAGRATDMHAGVHIPVHDIAVEACRGWLRRNLRGLNVDRDVRIASRLHPGSTDLTRLFNAAGAAPLANDTSCGAGFAPLTDLERVVLEVERSLNDPETKRLRPDIGEDIKVMGVRRNDRINLTIGCAFVSGFIRDLDDYCGKKAAARDLALEASRRVTRLEVDAVVNAADDLEKGAVFLTVTGTSAESGDDGEVGRGNRTCGLITPYRAMTLEAAAGKNPVSHVGKIYNLLAGRIAGALAADVPDVRNAECVLVSEIGRAISDPQVVDIGLTCDVDAGARGLKEAATAIVRAEIERLSELRGDILAERVRLF
jgi:S-adenosylmethionine synthetase